MYTVVPLLLPHSSAVFMNLSFLTADFWSLLIAVRAQPAMFRTLHFLFPFD
jgi:hypothetical protein